MSSLFILDTGAGHSEPQWMDWFKSESLWDLPVKTDMHELRPGCSVVSSACLGPRPIVGYSQIVSDEVPVSGPLGSME